jgi:hypothetical protein
MRKSFLIFSAIIFLSLLLITCAKEYSYEGGPLAEYTIEGSPAECAPVILSGNYYIGVAANSNNYIQVTVDVTLTGTYNIFTIPIDGISFSSAGNFTDTGKQVVTLACIGTPNSVGNFVIKIPGNNGCYFNLTVHNKAPSSYVLTGGPGDCSNPDISGRYAMGKDITSDDTVVLHVNVVIPGTYAIKTDTINGISFSASGYFSLPGNQTVTLTCTGKPNAAGRIFYNVFADSSQCNFNIPIEPGFPQAIYVLQSGSANNTDLCTPETAQGNYVAGISLNGSNTVSITAYATVAGTYSIYTTKVNGMVFGSSGTFPAAGFQTVVLSGSGTPVAAGSFLFLPSIIGPAPIGGSTCGFNLVVQ